MVNQAAQTLGRLAKGKPKTMSKAAITQRQRAAKASAKARKGRKRGKTLIQVFAEEAKKNKKRVLTTESLSSNVGYAKHQTEPNAGSPLHSEAPAQRESGT